MSGQKIIVTDLGNDDSGEKFDLFGYLVNELEAHGIRAHLEIRDDSGTLIERGQRVNATADDVNAAFRTILEADDGLGVGARP